MWHTVLPEDWSAMRLSLSADTQDSAIHIAGLSNGCAWTSVSFVLGHNMSRRSMHLIRYTALPSTHSHWSTSILSRHIIWCQGGSSCSTSLSNVAAQGLDLKFPTDWRAFAVQWERDACVDPGSQGRGRAAQEAGRAGHATAGSGAVQEGPRVRLRPGQLLALQDASGWCAHPSQLGAAKHSRACAVPCSTADTEPASEA